MPLLPLTGEFESDYYIVTGHMAFPDDQDLRERYIHCQRFLDHAKSVEKESWRDVALSFPPELLRDLILDPKDIGSIYTKSMRNLYVATMIPSLLVSMFVAGIKEPSIKKAYFYLSEFRVDEQGDTAFSESSLKKLWSKYKGVAHLYLPRNFDTEFTFWLSPWSISLVDKNVFYHSLSYSGHLYNFIASLPNRNSNGIYNGEEWVVPSEYIKGEMPTFDISGSSLDVLKAILDDYVVDRPF